MEPSRPSSGPSGGPPAPVSSPPFEQALTAALDRLVGAGRVKVQEGGAWLAALDGFRYRVRPQGDRPLLHLWSAERDLVRRVLQISEDGPERLALEVVRLGRARPELLEFLAVEDGRASRRAVRERFCVRFRDLLSEKFPDETPVALTTAANLRYSLSGNYARGLLVRNSEAWAVLGAAPGESAATCDALLDFGLLWFDHVRKSKERRRIAGLRLFMPQGADRLTAHRLRALRPGVAVELYEYDPDRWRLRRLDVRDIGNLETSLVPHREMELLIARAGPEIARLLDIAKIEGAEARAIETQAVTPMNPMATGEVALRFRGLLFARLTPAGAFFGAGDAPDPLTPQNESELAALARDLETHRSPLTEAAHHPLYRAQPERWLQSMVAADPTRVDPRLDPRFLYGQVPAFAAGDRGVLDLLGITRSGRLAVLELKANEDLHLAWQAVDYWLRVRWHQRQQDFQKFGYFPGVQLDPRPPLLFLVAPALRFHPATKTLASFFDSEIECVRVGFSESWRRGLKVVLRDPA